MARGQGVVPGGLARQRVTVQDLGALPSAEQQRLRVLLIERDAVLGAVDLEPQAVLPPGRDLRDHEAAAGSLAGAEHDLHRVLGRDGGELVPVWTTTQIIAPASARRRECG